MYILYGWLIFREFVRRLLKPPPLPTPVLLIAVLVTGAAIKLTSLILTPFHSSPRQQTRVQVAQLPLSVSDGRWHHICITWTTRDGFWEAYQDGERLGTGDNLAPWHPIKSGGVIILGQEQVRALDELTLHKASVCVCFPCMTKIAGGIFLLDLVPRVRCKGDRDKVTLLTLLCCLIQHLQR